MSTPDPSVTDVLRFVWSYWRTQRAAMFFLFVTMASAVVFDALVPVFVGRLIDALAPGDSLEAARSLDSVWRELFSMMGLWALYVLFRETAYRRWMSFAGDIMKRMVPDVFARVQRFSSEWHANNFAGATVRRISRGMWAYDSLADAIYLGLLPAVLIVVTATALVGARWPVMGLFLAASFIVYVAVSVILSTRYIGPANEAANEADSRIGAVLSDAITSNSVVKSFASEPREDGRMRETMAHWRGVAVRSWVRMQNTFALQSLITLCLRGGLLGMAIVQWSRGAASAGDVVFVITTYLVADSYLAEIGRNVREAQRGINELQDMVAFAAMEPQVADDPGAPDLAVTTGGVRFEKVGFRYDNQSDRIYENFDLEIAPGEKVALVGRTGSGKSTLVRLLQRLYDVESGRVLVDGQDISSVTQSSLRRAIAEVPQEPLLFHRSLAENIGYGRPDAPVAEVEVSARRAHADVFIRDLRKGYDTLVGERGIKLSGGERQRVALARAFLCDAAILVLDEATSSLDSVTEAAIQDATAALIEGRTTIIIAHRLSTVRMVDRILVFEKGEIVEQGRHDELVARSGGLYRKLYTQQADAFGTLRDDSAEVVG